MTILQGIYQPPRLPCAGGATPGAKAFMSWFLGAYGARGATNLGIYGCRNVGTTGSASKHGDGLADDCGIPPEARATWGWELVLWLRDHSAELGIQQIIYDRRIWACNHGTTFRDYSVPPGGSAHVEHAHVEFTDAAGRTLTVARINAVAGGDMPEIMVNVTDGRRGVYLSNYQTYRPVGGDGEWDFHTKRGIKTEDILEARLTRYGVPAADVTDAEIARLADLIGDRMVEQGGLGLSKLDVQDALVQVLRNGVM